MIERAIDVRSRGAPRRRHVALWGVALVALSAGPRVPARADGGRPAPGVPTVGAPRPVARDPSLPWPLGFDAASTRERTAFRARALASGVLDEATRRSIERGRALFQKVFTPRDGLGPFFNQSSCLACHSVPAPLGRGRPGELAHFFAGTRTPTDADLSTLAVMKPANTLPGHAPLALPPDFAHAAVRVPPQLQGLGWIEVVPVEQLRRLPRTPRPEPGRHKAPLGYLPERDNGAGSLRFSLKLGVATIDEFIIGAFHNELGITVENPVFDRDDDGVPDPELGNRDLIDVANFVAFSPPPARPLPRQHAAGYRTFRAIGCAGCHESSFTVLGRPVPQLYSDLLAHDLGDGLADERAIEDLPRQYSRTTPLWAMHLHRGPYLHDGSAPTVEAAILRHGGEAETARRGFERLDAKKKAQLLAAVAAL